MFEALLGSVFTPVLYAAGVLGVTVLADPQYLYVAGVTVAQEVEDRGYPEHEASARLGNAIILIDQKAKNIQPSKQIAVLDANSPVEIIGNQLNLTPFVRVLQHAVGLVDKSMSGAITMANGEDVEFTVRVSRDNGDRVALAHRAPLKDLDALFDKVAYDAYRIVAPYSYALLELEKGLKSRKFDPVKSHVAQMVQSAPYRHERAWFHNLRGLVESLEGEHALAQASFAKALVESPTPFPLGRLNLGYSKYLAGDDAGAIEEYRIGLIMLGVPFETRGVLRTVYDASAQGVAHIYNSVVEFHDRAPRPYYSRHALIAGLLTAWALVEERAGRNDCAEVLYAMALKSDASNGYARADYIALLKKLGRDAEANQLVIEIDGTRSQSHEDLLSLLRLSDRVKQMTQASR